MDVVEATRGWYWTVEVIAMVGAEMHVAHPLAIKGFENRRAKTDWLDAELLADLLRMDRLPEAWFAPRPARELRELVRSRCKLSQLRSGLKAPGPPDAGQGRGRSRSPRASGGPGGLRWLDDLQMADAYTDGIANRCRVLVVASGRR